MSLAHNPRIVTDGLVLCLDAANPKSYPGSGTTWYDLSKNGFNATLYNSPEYVNNKLRFDGIDSYAEINPGLKSVIESAEDFTILTFANIKFIEHVDNLVGWGNANTDGTGYSRTFGQYARGSALGTSYALTPFGSSELLNKDLCYTSRYQGQTYYSNTYGAVTNVDSDTYSDTYTWKGVSTSYPITIAKTSYYSRWMEVDIGAIQMYNRLLSDAEVKQNYNALKGRYGL